MTNILSDQQFSFLADEAMHTGFSIKAIGPNAGERASYGYMVGMAGHGKDIEPAADVTGQHLKDYVLSKQDILAESDKYLGGWRGTEGEGEDAVHHASLDVAQKFNLFGSGQRKALTAMIEANQYAMGQLHEHNQYTQIDNPFYDKSAPQTGRPLRSEEVRWIDQQTFPVGRNVRDLFRSPHGG